MNTITFIRILKNEILYFPPIRLCGRRLLTPCCCLLTTVFFVLFIIMIYLEIMFQTYDNYTKFIKTHPFSSVPFWRDTRVQNQIPLKPVLNIEQVDLSHATIAITACCRNVRKNLQGFKRNIQLITALFGDYRIYLEESDSWDGTYEFLEQWQSNDSAHVRVRSKGSTTYSVPSRTARLALCRNGLLAQAHAEISSFDYYLVIDVDVGSSSSFVISDFLTNFIYPPTSWLAMTATQRSEYYDIWALRIAPIITYDCWEVVDRLTNHLISRDYLADHLVSIHQESIPRNVSLIAVQSAFGGAAVYNGKYFNKQCLYNGTITDGYWFFVEQCEHVSFHHCLQQFAPEQKIYINPKFQIC